MTSREREAESAPNSMCTAAHRVGCLAENFGHRDDKGVRRKRRRWSHLLVLRVLGAANVAPALPARERATAERTGSASADQTSFGYCYRSTSRGRGQQQSLWPRNVSLRARTHLRTTWQPSHFFFSADRTFMPRLLSAQAPTARALGVGLLARTTDRSEGRTEARSELADRREDEATSWDGAGEDRTSGRRSEKKRGSMARGSERCLSVLL